MPTSTIIKMIVHKTSAPFALFSGAVGFLANLAGATALFGAVYAFFYPGEAARAVASFEDHLIAAREDLGRIAAATEATAENTGRTADNTDRIAAAIPSWVVFDGGIYRSLVYERSGPYWMNRQTLSNPSNYPIDLAWSVYAGGELVASDTTTVMPLEDVNLIWREVEEEGVIICLSGRSGALPDTFYEKRTFSSDRVAPVRSFSPIEGC